MEPGEHRPAAPFPRHVETRAYLDETIVSGADRKLTQERVHAFSNCLRTVPLQVSPCKAELANNISFWGEVVSPDSHGQENH